jgi:osmoprotectant transport system permease protein
MAEGGMTALAQFPVAFLGQFGSALDFIAHGKEAQTGEVHVGGPDEILNLTVTHLEVTVLALLLALVVALPAGLLLGHYGTGELLAVGIGNAGRAVPELALVIFMAAVIGVGLLNLTFALAILAVPPILTNTFVAMRQVDPGAVEAARGMGMTTGEVITRVELPLATPTIMSGVRTSTINVVATATIGPLIGVLTLGDLILEPAVYGEDGVIAGAICVAVLALVLELLLAGLQRALTSPGLRLTRANA